MGNEAVGRDRPIAFVGRPTVFDVGIGVLYFFTSHMVIRAMYYIGVDRTPFELTAFFVIVIVSAILAHLLAKPLLRARLFVESSLGVPAVSATATLGVTLALVSMLPVINVELFYFSAVLLGLSCGWIVVVWTSTIRAARPDANSFYIDPSLVIAVVSYFLFRCVSTFSEIIAQGFLLALPLVAIVCIIRGGADDAGGGATVIGERARSLQVLVVVAAAFALGCSVVVYLSGREDCYLSSGLNYMVLFEVLAIVLMVFCCGLMSRFSKSGSALGPRGTAVLTFCVCCLPMFFIGVVMGGAGIPEHAPDALWETNMWVLIIAIFAYDIRDSLFAVKGLAVGLMFEVMCVGQMIARVSALGSSYAVVVAVGLGALYFASIWRQLCGPHAPKGEARAGRKAKRGLPAERTGASTIGRHVEAFVSASGAAKPENAPGEGEAGSVHENGPSGGVEPDAREASGEDGVPSEILSYCQKLALDYGLTPREAEILGLIAMGRSAKYIAEELQISYNTTRTHIKHVYEKLNIHTKQELIDLVLFGSGAM